MSFMLFCTSSYRYNCIHGGGASHPCAFIVCCLAAWTSSSEVVDWEDNVTCTPREAAARATSSSPSPPASFCMALGAMLIGSGDDQPKSLVEVSTLETSTNTRGLINKLFVGMSLDRKSV